jgi:hypothetical protein
VVGNGACKAAANATECKEAEYGAQIGFTDDDLSDFYEGELGIDEEVQVGGGDCGYSANRR